MKTILNRATPILVALFLAVDNAPAEVIVEAPGAIIAGKTISEWTAAWWQWAVTLAPPGDPFTDPTGEFANVKQSGPVYFLAGSPSGSRSRNFTVPANTYVLVPLLAGEWSQLELGFDKTADYIRLAAQQQADQFDSLHATLDGTTIEQATLFSHRQASPDFSFVSMSGNSVNVPPGASGIAVADGYFLMLAPLSPGPHVLNYGGGASAFGINLNETDTITAVVPATRYVDVNSATPAPPYTSWSTAATDIQAAVDAAVAGDQILVTNGIYQTGGTVVPSAGGTNRVAVTKAVTIHSVNGPQSTVIRGYQVPGITNGLSAIRCVYLTSGASLSGFTLTNGATKYGQSGGGVWCQSSASVVSNCVLAGNAAAGGGGVYGGTLNNCWLVGNSVDSYGGGAYRGTLNNCTLTGNSASYQGGGAFQTSLNNCELSRNSTSYQGGGAYGGTLRNCVLTGNSATSGGAGAYNSTLNNCTLTANSTEEDGEWANASTRNNCIFYMNTIAGACVDCNSPGSLAGGNWYGDPQLASASHLSATSPCRGAGSVLYASGTDIDGEAWANPPSIGCDEYHSGAVTGPLSVAMAATLTAVLPNHTVGLTALIQGPTTASFWDFGDGTVVSNQPYTIHAWKALGDYPVVLRAYNDSQPAGISATVTVHVITQPVHYVAANNSNPLSPYTSWATAATNIQDAVDAATVPGALVLVTNGNYAMGGRAVYGLMTNRVAVDKVLELRSVNGPQFSIIQGRQLPGIGNGLGAIRCVYLTNGASLSGFTLTNGATRDYGGGDSLRERRGGGICCDSATSIVFNCVITGNSAQEYGGGSYGGTLKNCVLNNNSAGYGGGASGGTLNNCSLVGNSASLGGGAESSDLYNCTLSGNSASDGGGAYGSQLNNCIAYYNVGANYAAGSVNYSCTTPLPKDGIGNISADPQLATAVYLSAGSPCRGAGSLAHASGLDIDGEAWANPPSIGCDEFYAGAVTGVLTVGIAAAFTNVPTGFPVDFTAMIGGRATASVWDFGDGTVTANRPYTSHAWSAVGDYEVLLTAYNASNPAGISTTVTVHVVTQPIHYVAASGSNPVHPYTSWFTAATNIQDAVDAATVPEALVLVTNGTYAVGEREAYYATNRVAVEKLLTLQSINGPTFTVINGSRKVRCVYLTSGARLTGFTLTNGVADSGGGLLCGSPATVISNCVIAGNSATGAGGGSSGGTLNNCVITKNSATLEGGGVAGGILNNCTLTGNIVTDDGSSGWYVAGGGAYGAVLNNCTLTGNSALVGGGASDGILNNCTLRMNSATLHGGGVFGGELNNCTVTGNSAPQGGGGVHSGTLKNCIVYYNTAPGGANNTASSTLNYCCTTPLPFGGLGNFTQAPLFVNQSVGNLRLQPTSPCINSGLNASAPAGPDLDGNPRIAAGTVDIGAYEFQSPASIISYAWLQQFGFPIDGSADYADSDSDRLNNWQEWIAGTVPTDASSTLRLLNPTNNVLGVTLRWQSVVGRTYFLQRAADLDSQPPFSLLTSNIFGQAGTTSFTDTTATGPGPFFYRVGVQ